MYKVLENTETEKDYQKQSVNCLIGSFKAKARENLKTVVLVSNANEAYNYYLQSNANHIRQFNVDDKKYYHVLEKTINIKEENESAFYYQIIELGTIELHKLTKIVEKAGGTIYDLNTDCVSASFKDNVMPFTIEKQLKKNEYNIANFYFDDKKTINRYKIIYEKERRIIERPAFIRREKYVNSVANWKIMVDVNEEDIKNVEPLVEKIIKSNKGINIDARAGCGKTHIIKLLQEKLTVLGKTYLSLAPTNKAARLMNNGMTIHKWVMKNLFRSQIDKIKCDYVFIDEISMVPEVFYKYFILLKRLKPKTKFIMCGDFEQLLAVKDRWTGDYKNDNQALFELCNGRRLQLTHCRRADNIMFDLCNPETIMNVEESQFKNEFTDRHIAFTNKKRIEINYIMMKKVVSKKKEKALKLKALTYDDNSQDVKLIKGMPIIARVNKLNLDIANNEEFTIKEIDFFNEIIIITDEFKKEIEIKFDEFQKLFYVAYCITTHKSQGGTFNFPYTIHEFYLFDSRLRYVALSRATKLEFINII